MAAISVTDVDRAIVTFCYTVEDRQTVVGRLRTEFILPWAFVQFPDSQDQRYIAPVSGNQTVGLGVLGSQVYVPGSEYMRNAPFPHEADFGSVSPPDGDLAKAGPRAIHYFGTV